MNYRKYYFGPEKVSATTYRVQIVTQNQNGSDISNLQELAIRATNPQEAFSLSIFIRNNEFNEFSTRAYVRDIAGQILFTGEYNSEMNLTLETDMPVYQVTVIREAGPDALGRDAFDYAEDQLRIQALTEQEAHLMADFICCLPFKGQVRRTYIQHIEHFDERY